MTVVSVELTLPESSPVQYLAATPSFLVGLLDDSVHLPSISRELDSAGGKAESRRLHWRVQRRSCFL